MPQPAQATSGRPHVARVPERNWPLPLAAAALCAYFAWFYSQSLPSLPPTEQGHPTTRGNLVGLVTLYPEELARTWLGDHGNWSLADRLPALAWSLAIQAAALVLGRAALRLARVDHLMPAGERPVYCFAVGASLVSLFMLALGLAGALHAARLIAVFVVAAVAYEFHARRRSTEPRPDRRWPWAGGGRWAWAVAPFALVIVLGGLLPPVDFDVREYHLQAPKEFFLRGRIEFLPHNVYANMALGSEMLTLAAMALSGDWWLGGLAGKTTTACFTLWIAWALAAFGTRYASPRAGVIAALVYVSIPWVVQTSCLGLIEPAVALFTLLACLTALDWRARLASGQDAWRLLALTGFLAGSAVACKYPAALFVLTPLGLWTSAMAWQHTGPRRTMALVLCFATAAALACGPWFVKNALSTGNPSYPLLYGLFDGATRTPELAARWAAAHDPPNFAGADLAGRIVDIAGRSEWLSPLVVPLAVWGASVFWRDRGVRWLVAYLGFYLAAWWLATHRIDRFWVPMLPIAALLAGLGAGEVITRRGRWVLGAMLAAGLWGNLVFATSGVSGWNRYFAPLAELRSAPERRPEPWHRWIDQHVPEGEAVLLVGDAAVYDFRVPVFYNTTFDPSLLEQWAAGHTAEEFRGELERRRITHVLVNWAEIDRYRSPGNYGFSDFVTRERFEQWVREGVLEPLAPLADSRALMYSVRRP
ncbi:MAG: phospholipid carrier-dependent glycosyltransferase [Pirellulales bacterium]|nr:phospholipid carrier-dependent glycosyltransferase [Pirellulales bacterium]